MKSFIFLAGLSLTMSLGSSAFAGEKLLCKLDPPSGNLRTVYLDGNEFIACETPSGADLAQADVKHKYCAAALVMISESTDAPTVGGILSGTTVKSALNGMPAGISVKFNYSRTSTLITGELILSNSSLAPAINLSIPIQSENYRCLAL